MLLALLLALAVLLTVVVPRLLAQWTLPRRVPGAGLLLWQAVSASAVFAGLMLAPLAVLGLVRDGPQLPEPSQDLPMLLLGLAVSALLAARLLYRAHQTGTALRRMRREHAELVDLLGDPGRRGPDGSPVTVLPHPTPTAYCLPGRRERVVLSEGMLERLTPDEQQAVLAHERAHLRGRHDLVLEFFTVLHGAVPAPARSQQALAEVRLLIELLADRAAVRAVGPVATGRALLGLAGGGTPQGSLGAGDRAVARVQLLDAPEPPRGLAAAVLALALLVVLVTGALAWGALLLG